MANKYVREIKDTNGNPIGCIDVYSILDAYEVPSAIGHAIKKLLMAGVRGSKGVKQDLSEAIQSIERELVKHKNEIDNAEIVKL